METDLLFWHWLVLGMVLVVAEMFVPTFFILWFGFGALIVGLVEIYAPMPTILPSVQGAAIETDQTLESELDLLSELHGEIE